METKTKGFKMCSEFAEQIRAEIIQKTKQDVKCYHTALGKAIVVQENSDDYKDILSLLTKVQHIIDRVLEEK